MSSFYFVTLGCKVNQYETQALREAWLGSGMHETPLPEEASHIVVNSCAITAKAVADTRAAVRRLRRMAPEAVLVLTGCAAGLLDGDLSGINAVVPQNHKADLLRGPEPFLPPHSRSENVSVAPDAPAALPSERENFPAFTVSGYHRSRAVLKVQDGCSHGCAYCIVPLTRGSARSRPPEESLAEVERLLEAGFRELVISGVNLRQYGHRGYGTEKGHDFWDLLASMEQRFAPDWAGRARLRVSSLDPAQLNEKALQVLAESRLVAPHLHLSLQSGSPSVLRRMGRGHYDPARIPELLTHLRAFWPLSGLGADILTGFPGETDAEHAETLALCDALPLSYAHVFPYSRRPGTRAAALPEQVLPELKKQRAADLRALAAAKKRAFLERQLSLDRVLVAREAPADDALFSDEPFRGVNEFYSECCSEAPFASGQALVPARPLRVEGDTLIVRPLEKP